MVASEMASEAVFMSIPQTYCKQSRTVNWIFLSTDCVRQQSVSKVCRLVSLGFLVIY